MKYAVGMDVGGTQVKAIAVADPFQVLAEACVPTLDDGSHRWMDQVALALARIVGTLGSEPAWVGLAAPGLVSRDQLSIHCMPGRLPALEGMRWQGLLGTAGPVPVLNDAHAALLGEVWQGAAQGCEHAILLTLGTGVGGAAWMDGRLLRGHLGRAGHFGHISLDPKGALGITNAPGCLEYAIGQCTLNDRSDGKFATTRELVSAFEAGDAVARSIWLASIESLAAGIISLVNVLDPEVVILGGGISQAGKSLFEPLREYMDRFEWRPGGAQVRVMPAKLGNRAGAIGAAWHAMGFSEPV